MSAAVKLAADAAGSLPALVLRRAAQRPGDAIMRRKIYGVWRPTSGAELTKAVADCAAGLAALGLAPGETAGLLAAPRPEWLIADLGAQCAGALSLGLHAERAPGELPRLLQTCAVRVLFVDTAAALDAALDLRDAGVGLKHIVCFDAAAAAEAQDPHVLSFDALLEKGAASPARKDAPWMESAPDAIAAILPTSGLSGPSRGALFSHRALCAAVEQSRALIDLREGDERLSLLAASHAFERVFGLYASLAAGVVVNFPESAETVFANLRELQPQIVSGPPALWNRIATTVALATAEATSLQRKLFEGALSSRGALANFFVLNKVRRDFGLSRARVALSGGSALAPAVLERFAALGVPLVDAYTLTEAGGMVATAEAGDRAFTLAPGVGAEIDASGALRLKTASAFSGYAAGARADCVALSTGDYGAARAGGFDLHGSEETTRASAGGRFSLLAVEDALTASPYVAACIIAGDAREALNALVFIDYENVVRYAQARSTPFTHFKSLAEAADVRTLIEQEIARVNAAVAPARIAAFTLADRQVASGDPELGPGLNLRRRIAFKTFAALGS